MPDNQDSAITPRLCTACGKAKPAIAFSPNGDRPRSRCKDCEAAMKRGGRRTANPVWFERRREGMELLALGQKRCSACLTAKDLDQFAPDPEKLGGVNRLCRRCNADQQTAKYRTNPEPQKLRTQARRLQNPDKTREAVRDWYLRNTEHAKAYRRRRDRDRLASDFRYTLSVRLRHQLRAVMRRYDAKRAARTFDLVGCTLGDLIKHFEALFTPGMSWDRLREIDIDHIMPVASFDLADPEQQRKCFHYTNLQPLWRSDNQAKTDMHPDVWAARLAKQRA